MIASVSRPSRSPLRGAFGRACRPSPDGHFARRMLATRSGIAAPCPLRDQPLNDPIPRHTLHAPPCLGPTRPKTFQARMALLASSTTFQAAAAPAGTKCSKRTDAGPTRFLSGACEARGALGLDRVIRVRATDQARNVRTVEAPAKSRFVVMQDSDVHGQPQSSFRASSSARPTWLTRTRLTSTGDRVRLS